MKPKIKLEDKDAGLREMLKRLKEIEGGRVKVGVLADGKGGAAHGRSDKSAITEGGHGSLTIAQIAAINEFGTEDGHVPSRPALRTTFDKMHPELTELGKKLIKGILDGAMDTRKALGIMGMTLANGVKRMITSGTGVPPPNAPSTIAKKGSSRPLVDTGRLVGAISYEVVLEDEAEEEESSE